MISSLIFTSIFSPEAIADCPNNHNAVDYSTATGSTSCTVGGTTICGPGAGSAANEIQCDLSGGTQGAELWMVEDYDTTAADYEIWGTYEGSKFCCTVFEADPSNPILDTVIINGTDEDDKLNLTVQIGGTFYNLQPASTLSLTTTVRGEEGEDIIHGSDAETSYSETLYGDHDTDYIYGHKGDDVIYGGDGAGDDSFGDYLYGQNGDDEMYGEDGDDVMDGGAGDDTMFGDEGDDGMDGGPGDDTMNGGEGADSMCGGSHTSGVGDNLNDGDSNPSADKLWGGEDADDSVYCGNILTQTDQESIASGFCSTTTITVRPSGCP